MLDSLWHRGKQIVSQSASEWLSAFLRLFNRKVGLTVCQITSLVHYLVVSEIADILLYIFGRLDPSRKENKGTLCNWPLYEVGFWGHIPFCDRCPGNPVLVMPSWRAGTALPPNVKLVAWYCIHWPISFPSARAVSIKQPGIVMIVDIWHFVVVKPQNYTPVMWQNKPAWDPGFPQITPLPIPMLIDHSLNMLGNCWLGVAPSRPNSVWKRLLCTQDLQQGVF